MWARNEGCLDTFACSWTQSLERYVQEWPQESPQDDCCMQCQRMCAGVFRMANHTSLLEIRGRLRFERNLLRSRACQADSKLKHMCAVLFRGTGEEQKWNNEENKHAFLIVACSRIVHSNAHPLRLTLPPTRPGACNTAGKGREKEFACSKLGHRSSEAHGLGQKRSAGLSQLGPDL